MRISRIVANFGACVLVATTGFSFAQSTQISAQAELQACLDTMKDVQTLEVDFVCEKRLAALETPLVSSGQLWIRKGNGKETTPAVRFSTQKPYVSELIVAEGKVLARSQHEESWTVEEQAKRPGLPMVMMQLGDWSTGDGGGDLGKQWEISRSGEAVAPVPNGAAATEPEGAKAHGVDVFDLKPRDEAMKGVIKRVQVAFEKAAKPEDRRTLVAVLIESAQGDQTRYWFVEAKVNVALGAEVFKPAGGGGGKP